MSEASSRKRFILAGAAITVVAIAGILIKFALIPVYHKMQGRHTVAEVVSLYGPKARDTWKVRLLVHKLDYPPRSIAFVALKDEKLLEVWTDADGGRVLLAKYPILAASGLMGPKLREGDGQVPEGIYSIEGLNPNSSYHLSMKVGYPNEFDRARGRDERRTNLGGDIFIHGKRASIGCLAMGDPGIEELFVLVADVGAANTRVIIAPCDFRAGCADPASLLPWVPQLYSGLRAALADYPSP